MFGAINPGDYLKEICVDNCPRIWPRIVGDGTEEDGENVDSTGERIPAEYATEVGRILYVDRKKPCYLMFKIMRSQCRALRNFFIANASIMDVIGASYIGISTKVFNINTNGVEQGESIGLLKFQATNDAFRFVNQEGKINRQEFLGGRFDIWNLTMCGDDHSLVPSVGNPDKMMNHMNVFHFVHVRKVTALTNYETATSLQQREQFEKEAEDQKQQLQQCFHYVSEFGGRLVVNTDRIARIRGVPVNNSAGIPQKHVYCTQWSGVHQFWKWFDSDKGKDFVEQMREFTGGDYQSLLFTACLDFHDLM